MTDSKNNSLETEITENISVLGDANNRVHWAGILHPLFMTCFFFSPPNVAHHIFNILFFNRCNKLSGLSTNMATSGRNVDLKKINQEADLIWTLMTL